METTIEICNQSTKNDIFPRKHPWFRVKVEFIEGVIDKEGNQIWPTMKQLSIKHAIPYAYLRKIASDRKWTIEKNNFITHYEHVKRQEKIKYLAKKSIRFDDKCIRIAEEAINKIETQLFGVVIDKDGVKEVKTIDELELIAKTVEKFQKIGRLALGNSTDNVTKNIKGNIDNMSFSEGIDLVARQIEGNPDLMKKIESEIVDK